MKQQRSIATMRCETVRVPNLHRPLRLNPTRDKMSISALVHCTYRRAAVSRVSRGGSGRHGMSDTISLCLIAVSVVPVAPGTRSPGAAGPSSAPKDKRY